jgi:hypothetical protein
VQISIFSSQQLDWFFILLLLHVLERAGKTANHGICL